MIPDINNSQCQLIVSLDPEEQQHSLYHSIQGHGAQNELDANIGQQGSRLNSQGDTKSKDQNKERKINQQLFTSLNQASTTENSRKNAFKQLVVYFHVNKFVKGLLSSIRPDSSFSKHHFELIGDNASSYKDQMKTNQIKRKMLQYENIVQMGMKLRLKFVNLKTMTKSKILSSYQSLPLIEPDSNFKNTWDVILCFARVYLVMIIPVIIVFENTTVSSNQPFQQVVISALLMIDILLRTFTIVYEQGVPIKDKSKLLARHLNCYTYLEILSLIASIIVAANLDELDNYFVLEEGGWPKVLLLGLYMQINNILELVDTFQQKIKPSKQINSIIELLKLVTVIMVIQHFCCCIWIVIGENYQRAGLIGWMQRVSNWSWESKYLEALYFMSVTMFTVGYGDISPLNSGEKIFCICYMFLSTLQLSYSVNTIGSILTQMKDSSESMRKKLTLINEYMEDKKIGPTLQSKVREYCNYYLRPEILDLRREQEELISMLPENLQDELKVEAAAVLLKNCSFFNDNFSKGTIHEMLQVATFENYQPGMSVHRTIEEPSLYVIEYGEVKMYHGKQFIRKFQKLESLNFQEFFTGVIDQKSDFKTTEFTSLLKISRRKFLEIVQGNQQDLEAFYSLQSQKDRHLVCFICGNTNHETLNCKLVHFTPDRERVIKSYCLKQTAHRKSYRRGDLKWPTLGRQSETEQGIEQFQTDYQEYIQDVMLEFLTAGDEFVKNDTENRLPPINSNPGGGTSQASVPDGRLHRSGTTQLSQKKQITSVYFKLKSQQAQLERGSELQAEVNKIQTELIIKLKRICEKRNLLSPWELQGVEYWYMKLLNHHQYTKEVQLDRIANFEKFQKEWNFDSVLLRLVRLKKILENTKEHSKFSPYILNVWSVLKRYYIKHSPPSEKFEEEPQSVQLQRQKFKRQTFAKRSTKINRKQIAPQDYSQNETRIEVEK